MDDRYNARIVAQRLRLLADVIDGACDTAIIDPNLNLYPFVHIGLQAADTPEEAMATATALAVLLGYGPPTYHEAEGKIGADGYRGPRVVCGHDSPCEQLVVPLW